MSNAQEKPVSLRKFALMAGKSDGGVRKWLKEHPATTAFIDGKVLPSIISREWGHGILSSWALDENGVWGQSAPVAPLAGSTVSTEIIDKTSGKQLQPNENEPSESRNVWGVDLDDDTWNELQKSNPTQSGESQAGDYADDIDDDVFYTGAEDVLNTPKDIAEFMKDIPPGTSKIEADRIYSVLRARKSKRELQKLEGELVDKGLVYQNLFEFAAIMRDTFLNIPDRVIDNILAADSRGDAHDILTKEINDTLKSLAEVGSIKLTQE